ncbi:hypothetical protein LSAT2_023853, partial [Lamellibrachia satsuma]
HCQTGEQPNADQSGCELCPRGTYQPTAGEAKCIDCPSKKSTKTAGAQNDNQCEVYCKDGELKDDAGVCVPCARGYYKNNTEYEFGPCNICPTNYTTPGVGAPSKDNCTIKNCTKGSHLDNSTNTCQICLKGYYQDKMWQESCIKCDKEKTTESNGATAASDCKPDCDPGREGRNGRCEPCQRGYYKGEKGAASCTMCSNDKITSGNGSTTVNDCDIANCTAGQYLDATNNVCINCKQSSYQPEKWQTECKPCLNDKITDGEGKTSESDCVTNCANGHGYNYTSGTCVVCPRGTYRIRVEAVTAPLTPGCVPCPVGKTTERTGSPNKGQCNIADCREGTYFTSDKQTCIICPRGEYQDEPWQEKGCKKCPDGKTTPSNHSTSFTDCKRDCPSGRELDETTGDCDFCPRGFYKDQAQHFNCQQCPSGLTTKSTGSTSASDCNQGNCSAGYMYDGTDCKACPVGQYQDKTSCEPCGNMMTTEKEGATSVTKCFSTNACTNGKNDCSQTDKGGICKPLGNGTTYTCSCRDAWEKQPGGNICRHKCDNPDYCLHGATCTKDDLENPKCLCTDKYEGERCDIRS